MRNPLSPISIKIAVFYLMQLSWLRSLASLYLVSPSLRCAVAVIEFIINFRGTAISRGILQAHLLEGKDARVWDSARTTPFLPPVCRKSRANGCSAISARDRARASKKSNDRKEGVRSPAGEKR